MTSSDLNITLIVSKGCQYAYRSMCLDKLSTMRHGALLCRLSLLKNWWEKMYVRIIFHDLGWRSLPMPEFQPSYQGDMMYGNHEILGWLLIKMSPRRQKTIRKTSDMSARVRERPYISMVWPDARLGQIPECVEFNTVHTSKRLCPCPCDSPLHSEKIEVAFSLTPRNGEG